MRQSSKTPLGYEEARSKVIALSGILSATVAVLTFFFVPAPIPLGGFDTSSILILSLPILLGTELGTVIVCVGEFVGTAFLLAFAGGPLYFLPGIVAVRGPEAYLVGKIGRSKFLDSGRQKRRELLAMIIGPIWETAGFIAADYYVYYFMYGPIGGTYALITLLWVLIDLIWVAPAIAVLQVVRKWLRTNYMDKQLGLEGNEVTKRKLFRISMAFILITWIILVFVPLALTSWGPPPPS
jgi:uncharacterized membrane protein